jgi:hypothetical protein
MAVEKDGIRGRSGDPQIPQSNVIIGVVAGWITTAACQPTSV